MYDRVPQVWEVSARLRALPPLVGSGVEWLVEKPGVKTLIVLFVVETGPAYLWLITFCTGAIQSSRLGVSYRSGIGEIGLLFQGVSSDVFLTLPVDSIGVTATSEVLLWLPCDQYVGLLDRVPLLLYPSIEYLPIYLG
jgi:hypothetical protein